MIRLLIDYVAYPSMFFNREQVLRNSTFELFYFRGELQWHPIKSNVRTNASIGLFACVYGGIRTASG